MTIVEVVDIDWMMDAERLDDELGDPDWMRPPAGAVRSQFAAPSGTLAMLSESPDSIDGDARPTFVLVPGVTGSKEDFALMFPLLVGAGFRVISYDQAGQYESRDAGPENLSPPRRTYDHGLFVRDLIAVLESLPAPAHVLGYSFAGTIAQLTLTRRPELFASIALLSCPPQVGQAFRGIKHGIGPLSWIATGALGAALMIWGIRRNFIPVPPARLRFVTHRFASTRRDSVADIIGLMKRTPDVRAAVAATDIPKLIAVGLHDLWPLSRHEEFARAIGASLRSYASGHSPCETAPHQLTRDLLTVCAGVGTAPDASAGSASA